MLHHRPRVATLFALLAVLVFVVTPGGAAAAPSKVPGAAKAKERAYGKHCGAKHKGAVRSGQRAKCLDAMAKLATGRSSSPRKACAALSRKKVRGERKSAFARCVSAGVKLLKFRGTTDGDDATGADDAGHDPNSEDPDAGDGAGRGDDLELGLGLDDGATAPDDDAPADPDDD